MLQDGSVASHDGGRGKADDLPVGEVPGHDCQDDADGREFDVALGGVGGHVFGREECLGVLGVVVAVPGALLDLSQRLAIGLPISSVATRASSAFCARNTAATRRSKALRSPKEVVRQWRYVWWARANVASICAAVNGSNASIT